LDCFHDVVGILGSQFQGGTHAESPFPMLK
jgi:hypothetical protein